MICGICKLGIRHGQHPEPIRVGVEGTEPAVMERLKVSEPVRPGLYHSCRDCITVLLPYVAKRVTAQHQKDERVQAALEDRAEAIVPLVTIEGLSANDLC